MTLRYTKAELMAEHDYATPQVVAGRRCHGGFDAEGRYLPPRTLVREPAIAAWTQALRARGGDLLACSSSMLAGVRVPNHEQQKLLLREGLGQTFWNTLTITGVIEARGRVLAEIPVPSFQAVIEEDLAGLAIGHLDQGLLVAHGLDEGGEPGRGIGGHDVMWFALRDLAFGPTDFAQPELPTTIARPDVGEPLPELARPQARMLSFLMNLLLIELRAEIGFAFTEALLLDPELFLDRRAQAEEAATVVARIRRDERVHLDSLRLFLGEARSLTFVGVDGSRIPGALLIDPFFADLVRWATVEQPALVAERTRATLRARILESPRGADIIERFVALEAAPDVVRVGGEPWLSH